MKDLKHAFGSPDPEFQDRVRQTLFRIEEKEETIVKKKLTFSMAMAMILCVCIITVSALASSALLAEKPDITQPPLSHSANEQPDPTSDPYKHIPLLTEVFWPEEAGVIFHLNENCENMSYPCTVCLFFDALEAGGKLCALCFNEMTDFASVPTLATQSPILSTPTPQPTSSPAWAGVTPMPTPPAESGYYYTPEDRFCHADPACLTDGDSFIGRAFEEDLIAMGKRACETCMEPFSYYHDTQGAYYHSAANCAHADGLLTETLPEDQLLALGLRDCPWCLGWYNRYYSFDDRYYHASSDCISFIGAETAKKHADEKTLLEIGWTPCETCFATTSSNSPSGLQVFSTPNGSFYHTLIDCSGMKNAEIVSLADALNRNQTPCPLCHTCYIEEGSDLYHMSVSCSRLSAPQTRLLNALPTEYQPCGLCVYFLELNSNLYHRFPRCSQFGADGKAHAYTSCSLDLTVLRGSTPCGLCAADSPSPLTTAPYPTPTFAERELLLNETHSATAVFLWDSDAPVYHSIYNCSGYEYLHQMELTEAVAKNLTPCPECLNTEDTVWYTQDSEHYHSYLHYAYLNLPDVIDRSPLDALADGKRPCLNCMLTETAKGDAALGSLPPLWSTGNSEIYFYDYTAGHSEYFHTASSCEAYPMTAPIAISFETAVRYELPPCPECSNLLEQVIISESTEKFYHIGDECSSIVSPKYITRWNAKLFGLKPCTDCAYTDIDRGSPIPTVPPQPAMPSSDNQQALRQWLLNEGEQRYCLTDLGYYSD